MNTKSQHYDPIHTKIVVVNDDITQSNVLTGLLQKEGFDVKAYSNAEKALDSLLNDSPPDLIITDLYMPGIDGWRFCRLLRSSEYKKYNHTPILVISATFAGSEGVRIITESGANAFLAAPVKGISLMKTIDDLLQHKSQRSPSRSLVVDASDEQAEILKRTFRTQGYDTDNARTLEEARYLFRNNIYEYVIINHNLPDGYGDILLQEFIKVQPYCVMVMTTVDPNPKLALNWLRQGASAHVFKPFEPEYLLELCQKSKKEKDLIHIRELLEKRTKRLLLTERRYRQLFERIQDGICVVDVNGQIIEANACLCRMLGYSQDELKTLNDFSHIAPLHWRKWEGDNIWNRCLLQNGYPDVYENEIMRKDGTKLHVEIQFHSISNNEALVPLFCSVIRDITARKQIEEERKLYDKRALQLQKRESLNRMAGAIAHKFNNLLAAAMGNMELAMNELPNSIKNNKYFNEVLNAHKEAANIGKLMLTCLGEVHEKQERINLVDIYHNSNSNIQSIVSDNIYIKVKECKSELFIKANREHMCEVLVNLVTNAYEAMVVKGGTIYISFNRIASQDIVDKYLYPIDWKATEPSYACIEVIDKEDGIAAEDMDKIFDPYFSKKFPGRGLGLAVVLGIIKSYNGAIVVQSMPGRGSNFKVLMPFDSEPLMIENAGENIIDDAINQNRMILLAEDEDVIRDVTKALLERLGYEVLTAENGIDAVDLFSKNKGRFGCVLCDLSMPGKDGLQTIEEIRSIEPSIPVVLTSGYGKNQYLDDRRFGQSLVFLQKPFQINELGKALRTALT